jgi:hypothetical protein
MDSGTGHEGGAVGRLLGNPGSHEQSRRRAPLQAAVALIPRGSPAPSSKLALSSGRAGARKGVGRETVRFGPDCIPYILLATPSRGQTRTPTERNSPDFAVKRFDDPTIVGPTDEHRELPRALTTRIAQYFSFSGDLGFFWVHGFSHYERSRPRRRIRRKPPWPNSASQSSESRPTPAGQVVAWLKSFSSTELRCNFSLASPPRRRDPTRQAGHAVARNDRLPVIRRGLAVMRLKPAIRQAVRALG